MNRGADCVEHLAWRLAPEQGTRPDTAHRSFKLRLPDRRTAPVSTAIRSTLRAEEKERKMSVELGNLKTVEIRNL